MRGGSHHGGHWRALIIARFSAFVAVFAEVVVVAGASFCEHSLPAHKSTCYAGLIVVINLIHKVSPY